MERLSGALRFLFYLSPWCLVFALSTEQPQVEQANDRLWSILKKKETQSSKALVIRKEHKLANGGKRSNRKNAYKKEKINKRAKRKVNAYKMRKSKGSAVAKRSVASVDFLYTYDSAFEDQGTYYIPIRVQGKLTQPATIYYQVMGGSAKQGDDYTIKENKVFLKPGTERAYIPINLVNDRKHEIDETVRLKIMGTHGVKLGRKDTFEFLILSHHID